jgi:hypothetical protein
VTWMASLQRTLAALHLTPQPPAHHLPPPGRPSSHDAALRQAVSRWQGEIDETLRRLEVDLNMRREQHEGAPRDAD